MPCIEGLKNREQSPSQNFYQTSSLQKGGGGGIIHCSSVEGFSSLPCNGLLIIRVEGSATFEELDLRVCLAPMVQVIVEDSEFWGLKRRR